MNESTACISYIRASLCILFPTRRCLILLLLVGYTDRVQMNVEKELPTWSFSSSKAFLTRNLLVSQLDHYTRRFIHHKQLVNCWKKFDELISKAKCRKQFLDLGPGSWSDLNSPITFIKPPTPQYTSNGKDHIDFNGRIP